jgi:hypothetical protein
MDHGAEDRIEPVGLIENISDEQPEMVGRRICQLAQIGGVGGQDADVVCAKVPHDDFLAHLVGRERSQRRDDNRVDLARGDDADDRLKSLSSHPVPGGADVLAEGDETVPILIDPSPDPLRLSEGGFAICGGFAYVTDYSQVPSALSCVLATDSFALSLNVFNDFAFSVVPGADSVGRESANARTWCARC